MECASKITASTPPGGAAHWTHGVEADASAPNSTHRAMLPSPPRSVTRTPNSCGSAGAWLGALQAQRPADETTGHAERSGMDDRSEQQLATAAGVESGQQQDMPSAAGFPSGQAGERPASGWTAKTTTKKHAKSRRPKPCRVVTERLLVSMDSLSRSAGGAATTPLCGRGENPVRMSQRRVSWSGTPYPGVGESVVLR